MIFQSIRQNIVIFNPISFETSDHRFSLVFFSVAFQNEHAKQNLPNDSAPLRIEQREQDENERKVTNQQALVKLKHASHS